MINTVVWNPCRCILTSLMMPKSFYEWCIPWWSCRTTIDCSRVSEQNEWQNLYPITHRVLRCWFPQNVSVERATAAMMATRLLFLWVQVKKYHRQPIRRLPKCFCENCVLSVVFKAYFIPCMWLSLTALTTSSHTGSVIRTITLCYTVLHSQICPNRPGLEEIAHLRLWKGTIRYDDSSQHCSTTLGIAVLVSILKLS